MSFKISNNLHSGTNLTSVVYANQQPFHNDDLNDEIAFYKDGLLTSSPDLAFDGDKLKVSTDTDIAGALRSGWSGPSPGGAPTGEPTTVGGWLNIRSNLEGQHPTSVHNSGLAGGSIGWNLSGGQGETVIMNNFSVAGQAVHFRMRSGATGSNLLAAIATSKPVPPLAGNLYTENVRISGQGTYMPGTPDVNRIRDVYRFVYSGIRDRAGTGNNPTSATTPIATSLLAGEATAFAGGIGDTSHRCYHRGMAFKNAGNVRAWITIKKDIPNPPLNDINVTLGTANNRWEVLLRNGVNAVAYWHVVWFQESGIPASG